MRYALWDALTRAPVDTDLPFSRTQWAQHLTSPDALAGVVPNPAADVLAALVPAGAIITAHEGDDVLFSGFVDRVTSTTDTTEVRVSCTSWRGYPARVVHATDQAWTRTDPGIIINELWAHALDWENAPDGVNYWYCRTPLRVGDPAVGVEGQDGYQAADPWRASWYLGTNLGTAINELAATAGITHTEHHLLDHQDRPFTEVHASYDDKPRYPDAVFVHGENIVEPITLDVQGADVATSVLSLGRGQGPARLAGDAWHTRSVLRSVYTDAGAPADAPKAQLVARARRLLARLSDPLPMESVVVLADHPHAQVGTWGVGDVVQVQLPGRTWWVRVTGIDWGAEDSQQATIHVARAEG